MQTPFQTTYNFKMADDGHSGSDARLCDPNVYETTTRADGSQQLVAIKDVLQRTLGKSSCSIKPLTLRMECLEM